MRFFFLISNFINRKNSNSRSFLLEEQEDIHTNNYISRDHILFDISFENKSETYLNIWYNK